jgi:hypothetical protein
VREKDRAENVYNQRFHFFGQMRNDVTWISFGSKLIHYFSAFDTQWLLRRGRNMRLCNNEIA